MVYVPRKSPEKQAGINNNDGEYEGVWTGPHEIAVADIKRSHMTSHTAKVAAGYEDKLIRIQPWPSGGYRIVDGNKRLAQAKRIGQEIIWAYVFVSKHRAHEC